MLDFFYEEISQNLNRKHIFQQQLSSSLAQASAILIAALRMGRKILSCGNGGSAGDAQHFASELVNHFEVKRLALPAIALDNNSALVTAIANDMGYEFLFSRQIECLGAKGDVLIVFSTSGNSRNIIQAIKQAQQQEMHVIACTGNDGGIISQMLNQYDVELRVTSSNTGEIQEAHLFIIHALCKALDAAFNTFIFNPISKIQKNSSDLITLTQGLRPIVFTNGVFDILHRGHLHMLEEAKKLGKYLIVAVNSDASVKRLSKGAERPINSLEDRMAMLASINCVDFVTLFDENTPQALIESLVPDVLVKGGDYKLEQIVGAEEVIAAGGRVFSIPFKYERSTTALIEKISVAYSKNSKD